MRKTVLSLLLCCLTAMTLQAQIIKPQDLENYAKERYGQNWLDAAKALGGTLQFDKNQSLTFQEVIQAPGKTKEQLYIMLNYWATATFKDKQAITLNDKESGTIIISSMLPAIADHTGTLNRYIVNITPVIRIDIKDGRTRVTYTVQNYDVLKAEDGGWLGGLLDNTKYDNKNQTVYSDGKRLNDDKTDHRLYDEQWEITRHYPFVEKDAQKRTCAKALVMTYAYSSVVLDKITEAVKNGLVGNENDDW